MISMMYAGFCTLLVIFLALRVVKWRRDVMAVFAIIGSIDSQVQ